MAGTINRMQAKVSGKPSMKEMCAEWWGMVVYEGDDDAETRYAAIVKKYHLSKPEADQLAREIDKEIRAL